MLILRGPDYFEQTEQSANIYVHVGISDANITLPYLKI